MNFFGIGLPEMAVIAAIGLLVFGPKRLPELGRTLGRTLKGFQSASSEFEKEFRTAISTVETTAEASASLEAAAGFGSEPSNQQGVMAAAAPAPATTATDVVESTTGGATPAQDGTSS
jgi:sec-independent protein translocase protein TatA